MPNKRRLDIIGNDYGCLHVNGFSHSDKDGKSHYECTCTCGNKKYLKSNYIIKYSSICICKTYLYQKDTDIISKQNGTMLTDNISLDIWHRIVYGAKQRGLDFSITPEYAEALLKEQNFRCYYTGEEISLPKYLRERFYTASLDRLDSDLGYIEGNVCWCHRTVNFMKHTMTKNDFILLCVDVANHNNLSSQS